MKSRLESYNYYRSLPRVQQELIDAIIYTTMDMYSEFTDVDIEFTEHMSYKAFKLDIIGHMLDNEYFDYNTKTWEQLKQ